MSGVYKRLVALAQREAEAIAVGAWDELTGIERERDALAAEVSAAPDADDTAALAEAERLVSANGATLAAALEAARGELDHMALGRRTLAGYGRRDHGPGVEARA